MAKKGNANKPNKTTLSTVHIYGDEKLALGCGMAIQHLHNTEEPAFQSAKMTANYAKTLVPKRTGALMASIRALPNGTVVADTPYAEVIHWGWRKRNIEPNWYLLDAARKTEFSWLYYWYAFTDEAIEKMAS